MAEFVTAVKYKLPIKIVIIKNNTLGQIKWEQMVFLGNPGIRGRSAAHRFCGFRAGLRRRRVLPSMIPADCGRIMEEFLNTPGPALIEAVVDPFEPPMPAKVKAEQALHFAESLARGEPNRKKIALTTISDKVRELI